MATDADHKIDRLIKMDPKDLVLEGLHEYDIDVATRQIYLMGVDRGYENGDTEPGVDYVMANRFVRNLNFCMRLSKDPILIIMKSCGGDEGEGMAIYDSIKACPNPITILSYNHARSMTSVILQAANKRVLMPNSYGLLHRGTLSTDGTATGVYSFIEWSKHIDKNIEDIYARRMIQQGEFKGKSQKAAKQWLNDRFDKKEDVYLTPSQMVKIGLADEVFNYNWAKLTKYTKEQLAK